MPPSASQRFPSKQPGSQTVLVPFEVLEKATWTSVSALCVKKQCYHESGSNKLDLFMLL